MVKKFDQLVIESAGRDIFAEIAAGRAEMKNSHAKVKKTKVIVSEVAQARLALQLTQDGFAELLGVSVRTLQEWEQSRRKPSKSAEVLVKVAIRHPEAVRDVTAFA